MTINPDTLLIDDCRSSEERHEDLRNAVIKVFEKAAEGRTEEEKKVLKDLAPVISDAVSAAIKAYNPKTNPSR